MITTNNLKRRPEGKPQRLTVLTTSKVKPKSPEAILAGIKAQRDVLARQVNARPTRKVTGPMLVIGGMEDRVMNQTRKLLREKVKAIRAMAAQKQIKTTKIPWKTIPEIIGDYPLPHPSEIPIVPPELPTVIHQVKAEIKPDGSMIALEDSRPEKKKRGRPKKEDKNE